MNLLAAIEQVLTQAGAPLSAPEITQRVLEAGLWQTNGKTPAQTVTARLVVDINSKRQTSRFLRTAPGIYALRAWPLPATGLSANGKSGNQPPRPKAPPSAPKAVSFTDAAEKILETFGNKRPMHYRAITEKALELKLIKTQGQTPEATLYAQVLTETNRQKRRGQAPRFVRHGQGYIGLSRWMATGLAFDIEQHNTKVKTKLRAQLLTTPANEFEALIGKLLVTLGFEDVAVTARSGDGGIDVRGTLVVGDVIKTRMAVQAKRWKQNVKSPTVQQVRGSLGTHDQGLIITTSDFSSGARAEAERPDAIPVALMNGAQLVALLVEHSLGVHRTTYDLIELGEAEEK
jgi:restriction system protein